MREHRQRLACLQRLDDRVSRRQNQLAVKLRGDERFPLRRNCAARKIFPEHLLGGKFVCKRHNRLSIDKQGHGVLVGDRLRRRRGRNLNRLHAYQIRLNLLQDYGACLLLRPRGTQSADCAEQKQYARRRE